jgi:hypothetical protein
MVDRDQPVRDTIELTQGVAVDAELADQVEGQPREEQNRRGDGRAPSHPRRLPEPEARPLLRARHDFETRIGVVTGRRTRIMRWIAPLALLAIGFGGVDLHVDTAGGLAAHGALHATEIVGPQAPCAPGQRAHFDSASSRVERPCEACLRSVEKRVVPAIGSALSPARDARWTPARHASPRVEKSLHSARSVRGPPARAAI